MIKAKTKFIYKGKAYQEGQEVPVDECDVKTLREYHYIVVEEGKKTKKVAKLETK